MIAPSQYCPTSYAQRTPCVRESGHPLPSHPAGWLAPTTHACTHLQPHPRPHPRRPPVVPLQVCQQLPALPQDLQQAAAGGKVLLVLAQVLGQLLHAGGEARNLVLGRAAVALVPLELLGLGQVGALAAVARAASGQASRQEGGWVGQRRSGGGVRRSVQKRKTRALLPAFARKVPAGVRRSVRIVRCANSEPSLGGCAWCGLAACHARRGNGWPLLPPHAAAAAGWPCSPPSPDCEGSGGAGDPGPRRRHLAPHKEACKAKRRAVGAHGPSSTSAGLVARCTRGSCSMQRTVGLTRLGLRKHGALHDAPPSAVWHRPAAVGWSLAAAAVQSGVVRRLEALTGRGRLVALADSSRHNECTAEEAIPALHSRCCIQARAPWPPSPPPSSGR